MLFERVTAYKLPNGQLEPDKEKAAVAYLRQLGEKAGGWDHEMTHGIASLIVQHRKKIVEILDAIDAPEPNYGDGHA